MCFFDRDFVTSMSKYVFLLKIRKTMAGQAWVLDLKRWSHAKSEANKYVKNDTKNVSNKCTKNGSQICQQMKSAGTFIDKSKVGGGRRPPPTFDLEINGTSFSFVGIIGTHFWYICLKHFGIIFDIFVGITFGTQITVVASKPFRF